MRSMVVGVLAVGRRLGSYRAAASTRFGDVAGEGRGLRLPAGLNRGAIFDPVLSLFKGLWRLFRFCGRKFGGRAN